MLKIVKLIIITQFLTACATGTQKIAIGLEEPTQLLLQSEGRKSLNQSLKVFIDEIERKKLARRVKWSIDVDPIELF